MIVLQALWLGAKISLVQMGSPPGALITNPENNPFTVSGPVLALFVIGTILVLVGPVSTFRRLTRLEETVRRHPWCGAVILATVAIGISLIPLFTFPFGGDEKRLYDVGTIFAEEGLHQFLYQYSETFGVGDRHPMLVPLLAGIGQAIVGDYPSIVRFLFLSFLSGSAVLTYAIGRRLYDGVTGFRAAILFLALRHVLFMGIRVSTDLPVTFFALLAVFLALRLREAPTIGRTVQLGGAVGFGLLSKYTFGLVFPLLGYIMLRGRRRTIWTFAVGTVIPLIVLLGGWIGVLYATGSLGEQMRTVAGLAGLGEGGNLFSSWHMRFRLEAILIHVPSALGAYSLPILAFGGVHLLRRWAKGEKILAVWVGTVFLLLLATLPVERYFLPAFPALAIVGAVGLRSMGEKAWRLLGIALLYSVGTVLLYT